MPKLRMMPFDFNGSLQAEQSICCLCVRLYVPIPDNKFWANDLTALIFGMLFYLDTIYMQSRRLKFTFTEETIVDKVVGATSSEVYLVTKVFSRPK